MALYLVPDFAESGVEVDVKLQSSIGSILLLAGISLALTSCSGVSAKEETESGEIVPVAAVRAVVQDIPLDIAAVGDVEAVNSVAVKSRVAGQIETVAFQEGQSVAKGQLLFTINRDTLQRQAAEQRAEMARDAAVQEQARAVVARDQASQTQSRAEAQVAIQLGKLGVISGQRVDELVTARETAQAGLRSDQAAAEAAAAAQQADLARLAETQLQLSLANVVAPIAGRAGAAMVRAGNLVGDNGTTLVTLLQITPIDVSFGVPEQVLTEVQRFNARGALGVEVSTGNGSPNEGQLVFIDNTVDSGTGTIRLKALFPNTDRALWPGEFVHVRLRLRTDHARIVVPNASIQDGINGRYTWIVRAGRATIVPVTVVRTYSQENEPELAVIGSGIRPGDLVVTRGQLRLTQNARVSLLPPMGSSTSSDTSAPQL